MTRTALIACAALFAATAAPALAGEAPRPEMRTAQPAARIAVNLCERDPLTQAAFRSRNGAHPVFVSADEVLSARAAGERWSTPRCMTANQHQELTQRLGVRAPL